MADFTIDIPVNSNYNKKKFYKFVNKNKYNRVIGSIFSKGDICIGYIDKDFINDDLVNKEVPTILISGNNLNSKLVQEVLNEILQLN